MTETENSAVASYVPHRFTVWNRMSLLERIHPCIVQVLPRGIQYFIGRNAFTAGTGESNLLSSAREDFYFRFRIHQPERSK